MQDWDVQYFLHRLIFMNVYSERHNIQYVGKVLICKNVGVGVVYLHKDLDISELNISTVVDLSLL